MIPLLENLSIPANCEPEDILISDNRYKVNILIMNSSKKLIRINYASIKELSIKDDISNFFLNGYIVFDNKLDVIESFDGAHTDGNPLFTPYTFRNDGRDFLYIYIMPNLVQDELNVGNNKHKNNPLALQQLFVVYDMEDIIFENKDEKLKKLYFYDYSYQLLAEKNAFFSTGSYSKGISNEDRSLYTGDAIKKLIEGVYKDYNITANFANDWDKGVSKIFYSSPAQYKAIDDLNYLLDYHVGSADTDYSPCLLKKNHEMWGLTPLSKIFSQAYYKGNKLGDLGGVRLLENFVLARPNVGDSGLSNNIKRSPSLSPNSLNQADYSLIENYQFSNISGEDTSNSIITNVVHNYNPNNKLFSIDLTENNLQKSVDIYTKHFVQTQKGKKGAAPSSNLTLNQTRLLNKNVVNRYNPNYDTFSRLNSGRNRFLFSGVFLNMSISFRCRGSVYRDAGSFFTVTRYDSQPQTEYDNKTLGIYFVTDVEHLFKEGGYYNNVIAVKTYNFSNKQTNYSNVV